MSSGMVCNNKEALSWQGLLNVMNRMKNIDEPRVVSVLQALTNDGYVAKNRKCVTLELNNNIHTWVVYGNGALCEQLKKFMVDNDLTFVCEETLVNTDECVYY